MTLTVPRTPGQRDAYTATATARRSYAGAICEAAWHPSCPVNAGVDRTTVRWHTARTKHETHHVVMRRHGGTDDFDNLRYVCIHCHHRIHQRWDEAEQRGLLSPASADRYRRDTAYRRPRWDRDDHGTHECWAAGCSCEDCTRVGDEIAARRRALDQEIRRHALLLADPVDTRLDPW